MGGVLLISTLVSVASSLSFAMPLSLGDHVPPSSVANIKLCLSNSPCSNDDTGSGYPLIKL